MRSLKRWIAWFAINYVAGFIVVSVYMAHYGLPGLRAFDLQYFIAGLPATACLFVMWRLLTMADRRAERYAARVADELVRRQARADYKHQPRFAGFIRSLSPAEFTFSDVRIRVIRGEVIAAWAVIVGLLIAAMLSNPYVRPLQSWLLVTLALLGSAGAFIYYNRLFHRSLAILDGSDSFAPYHRELRPRFWLFEQRLQKLNTPLVYLLSAAICLLVLHVYATYFFATIMYALHS